MGWLYSMNWRSKKQLLEHLQSQERFGNHLERIKSSVVGNNHWYLAKHVKTQVIWIGLDLMRSGREDGWGYKDMDSTCGPVEVNCPISFLKAASPAKPDSYDEKWRERVKQYHESKKQKAKRKLERNAVARYGGIEYALSSPAGPRRGWFVNRVSDNREFRMSAKQLGQAEIRGVDY